MEKESAPSMVYNYYVTWATTRGLSTAVITLEKPIRSMEDLNGPLMRCLDVNSVYPVQTIVAFSKFED